MKRRNKIWNKKWYKQIQIKSGERPVYYHRFIMSEKLGRPLKTCEVVHHINGDFTDNRIENLEVMTKSDHQRLHHSKWPKICSIQNCGKDQIAHGFCAMHYSRLRKYGNPLITVNKSYKPDHKCIYPGCTITNVIFRKGFCQKHYRLYKK